MNVHICLSHEQITFYPVVGKTAYVSSSLHMSRMVFSPSSPEAIVFVSIGDEIKISIDIPHLVAVGSTSRFYSCVHITGISLIEETCVNLL